MWVYDCFEGDDMDMAWAQHDLYFGRDLRTEDWIGRFSTPKYIWQVCASRVSDLESVDPWCERNGRKLVAMEGFDHRIVQSHHAHLAAHFRWGVWPEIRRSMSFSGDPAQRRYEYIREWRWYVQTEVPLQMESREILMAWAKLFVYRQFDASDRAAETLKRCFAERYGLACMSKTGLMETQSGSVLPDADGRPA